MGDGPIEVTNAKLVKGYIPFENRFEELNVVRFNNPTVGMYKMPDGQEIETIFFEVEGPETQDGARPKLSIGEILANRIQMLRYDVTKGELLEFTINNKIISCVIFSCGLSNAGQAAEAIKQQGLNKGLLKLNVDGNVRNGGRMDYYILDILGGDLDKNARNIKFAYWSKLGGIATRLVKTLLSEVSRVVPEDKEKSKLTAYYDADISKHDSAAESKGELVMEDLLMNVKDFQRAETGRKIRAVPFTVNYSATIINSKIHSVLKQIQTQ